MSIRVPINPSSLAPYTSAPSVFIRATSILHITDPLRPHLYCPAALPAARLFICISISNSHQVQYSIGQYPRYLPIRPLSETVHKKCISGNYKRKKQKKKQKYKSIPANSSTALRHQILTSDIKYPTFQHSPP